LYQNTSSETVSPATGSSPHYHEKPPRATACGTRVARDPQTFSRSRVRRGRGMSAGELPGVTGADLLRRWVMTGVLRCKTAGFDFRPSPLAMKRAYASLNGWSIGTGRT
jgi:hypothetical protein